MKLKLLLLLNITFIFNLTLVNTTSIEEECQTFYSIINNNNGKCREDSYDNTGTSSFAIPKDGHINEL